MTKVLIIKHQETCLQTKVQDTRTNEARGGKAPVKQAVAGGRNGSDRIGRRLGDSGGVRGLPHAREGWG
jgi:hypothetical protein